MLIVNIIKGLQKIYQEKPKKEKNPGRPKSYTDYQIALICIIMRLKRINSFSGIIKYLESEKEVQKAIGLTKILDRTTLSRRSTKIHKKLREIVQKLGEYYCEMMKEEVLFASEDASLFKAQGPLWHVKYRHKGIIPDGLRNVDRESQWGYSPTRGFIQGYKGHFNVVCDFQMKYPVFPIDAIVTTANVSDYKKGRTLYSHLKNNVKVQFADKGYDDEKFFIEQWLKGRLFITPVKKNQKMKRITLLRYCLYQIMQKMKWNKRGVTVEPFNGRIKSLFGLEPLPEKGKKKANILILAATIGYQLIILFNFEHHRKLGAVKEILDKM
jgi:hypothetical protein